MSSHIKISPDCPDQLCNPLAAIKVQAQAALATNGERELRDGLAQITRACDKTSRMIKLMLSSASAHTLSPDAMLDFDVSRIVKEVTQEAASTALARNQEIELVLPEDPVQLEGSEILIREAVINLIDNAIRHNSDGITIEVFLSVAAGKEIVIIGVRDTGTPLSQSDLAHLSQPFATGASCSAGSGLGLALAKDVARSHLGQLELSSAKIGQGKTIAMRLPRRRRPVGAKPAT